MLEKVRRVVKQTGQGIIEYALILAFVVGIAMMLNSSNLGGAVNGIIDYVADYLNYRKYSEYYAEWHNLSNEELRKIANVKRIKADQQGLQRLAAAFLGLSESDALAQLKIFTRDDNDIKKVKAGTDNNSQALTVLKFWDHYDNKSGERYVTLGRPESAYAMSYLTEGQATTVSYDSTHSNKSTSQDRFFYSNDVTGDTNQRTVTAVLHYDSNKKVDSVHIVTHKGDQNGTVSEGLDYLLHNINNERGMQKTG